MRRVGLPFALKRPALAVLLLGMVTSCSVFFAVYSQEERAVRATFERRAQFRIATVQQGMSNAIDALRVVNQLFVATGSVSREQFHTFTQPLLARYPYIEAFAFQRLVSRAQRPQFEAEMRARYPGFTIDELVNGKRVVAAVRERYSVIDYREPEARNNKAAFGLDATTLPFREAIAHAEETGLPAATGLFRIFHGNGEQISFRILMAVYRGGALLDDAASRRLAVSGYTVAVLRVRALLKKILASAGSSGDSGLDIRIYAAASADESKLAYGQPRAPSPADREPFRSTGLLGKPVESVSRSFDVAGTAWHMVVSARPTPFTATHDGALYVLLIGLIGTCAASAYLQSVASRAQRIQQLVAQRTGELKQVNQALVRSEERAHELAGLSSDWFWEQDQQFRYTSYSTKLAGRGSPPAPRMVGLTRWELPVDVDVSDWPAHRALLKTHQPYKDFEFKTQIDDLPSQWFSSSGKPLFDAEGRFTGYLGTCRNISVRKAAEEAMQHSRTALRKLASHQANVKEDERKRIARDIHDDLGQNLMVLRIDLSLLAADGTLPPGVKKRLDAALHQIDATIKAVRAIINDLRPAVLDLGLHAAVEWQVKEFERRSGIACNLYIDHEEFALDDRCATALFHIVQESLTNIMRHAQASHVQVEMRRRDGRLILKIADDGVGLAPGSGKKKNTFGLAGIKERIYALGGTCSTESVAGRGMAITLTVPIDPERDSLARRSTDM